MKSIMNKIGIWTCCLFMILSSHFFYEVKEVQAESVQKIANLVIFAKLKGDERDIYNAVYTTPTYTVSNWEQIRKMYDGGTGYNNDNSFSNYIRTISEGQIEVINIFPQEYTDPSDGLRKVKTFELSQSHYDIDAVMVGEIVQAVQNGTIPVDPDIKMDYMDKGVLDNLTIVIQGEDINGSDHSYKADYSGDETIGTGLYVRSYNAFHSSSLVSDDGSINVSSQQGVIAHEFLHVLGFPDLYRLNGGGMPVGMWDVMGGVTCFLQYPLGYLRMKMGWIQGQEITQEGTYTLRNVTQDGGNKLFLIKTPLAQADTETICLEYRRLSDDINGFEHIIGYEGGLLMYRINKSISDASNFKGENYIYVFRPDVSDPELGNDVNEYNFNTVSKAALNVKNGETEYGSTDLSKDFTANTLYYSDGQNSGIKISNCRLSEDGNDLTFDVEFADYDTVDMWDAVGNPINGNGSLENPVLFSDDRNLYVSYMELNGSSATAFFKKWNESQGEWQQAAPAIPNCDISTPLQIAATDQTLTVLYTSGNTHVPVIRKYDGKSWSNEQALTNTPYPMNLQFIQDGKLLYAAYQYSGAGGNSICLIDLQTMKVMDQGSIYAKDFSNPAFLKDGNSIYMAYTDFADGSSKIARFDCGSSSWSTVHEVSVPYANCHFAKMDNGRKIFYFSHQDSAPIISIHNGTEWKDIPVSQMKGAQMPSMNILNGNLVLSYLDSDSQFITLKQEQESFVQLFSTSYPKLLYIDICSLNNTLYSASKALNSTVLVVRKKELLSNENPLTLKITPPVGYTDHHLWIDGKEMTATQKNGALQVILKDKQAKSAVMYQYNEKQIPIGMSVWKLTYPNGQVQAELLEGLTDLLTYHGFSIRVQSPSGIRFKSGIDQNLKNSLIHSQVNGYHLVEYGTLFITQANRMQYPFIKDGEKVGGGRAYWVSNGTVNDKIFETSGGRIRFTSVLINLSQDQYATDIAFRSYIILEDQDGRMIVYGPPVARSIYTIAKQVLAGNEFKAGSSGYNYVKGIIDSVEKK